MPMYLSLSLVQEAIRKLSKFHVFFGTTFLVLKRNESPVGKTMRLSLDAENRQHLKRYFRLHPKSDYFFTPFQTKKGEGRWRDPKYPSTSLQAINTQGFSDALMHVKKEKDWGWATDYISILKSKLPRDQKLPLQYLAIWFSRDEIWPDSAKLDDVVAKFVQSFKLSNFELNEIFDIQIKSPNLDGEGFQAAPPKWDSIIADYGNPPDVALDSGAILQYLEFTGLGPIRNLCYSPSRRINLITGDNGLGKTFLLDVVWWALTREWAERMIAPFESPATSPTIKFSVSPHPNQRPNLAEFDSRNNRWRVPSASAVSGLVVYARVDGSFAVWDPANPSLSKKDSLGKSQFTSFDRDQIWKGDQGNKIEGLLRDWVRWQTRPNEFPAFTTFKKVVERTKPPDLGTFEIGSPVRVDGWSMEIPTLIHPYGQVPIVFESAGIRRILTLAYLIVWAWEEHKVQAKRTGRKEERQLVILLDEAEAHLHPRWQRVLLSALLGIAKDLHEELDIQYFIASHSPLILASSESVWDDAIDSLSHLRMDKNGKISFEKLPFELRGTANAWLQSPSFDRLHPGSEEAEDILAHAKSLLKKGGVSAKEVDETSQKLANHIAAEDPFWLRWTIFTAKYRSQQ